MRMKNVTVNLFKVRENAIVPTRGTEYSAGSDLYACINSSIEFKPNETVMVGSGIAVEIPTGYVGLVFARSGLASKIGLAPANKVGVIDSDYRGEVKVALHNHSDDVVSISPNERIAQLVVVPYLPVEFNEVDSLSDTERGDGGFGSTGYK